MTSQDFLFIFRLECKQHKIADVQPVMRGASSETLALCNAAENKIEFFSGCLSLSYENAVEVIRHELAHLLDYRETGGWKKHPSGRNDFHGQSWKRFCKQLGCRARRYIPRNAWGF